MRVCLLFLVSFILVSCVSGYQKFYVPYVDAKELSNVDFLQKGENPTIFNTASISTLDKDINLLRARKYIPIGYASFNGKYEDRKSIIAQAKKLRALVVLSTSKYTDTQTINSVVAIPNYSTTYHSGSVYSGNYYGSYSGTSTTSSNAFIPVTTRQRNYNQMAVFFVRDNQKFRFGIFMHDLDIEHRIKLDRNKGALVDIIYEKSPAFYAGMLAGDVIVKINNTDILDAKHAVKLMKDFKGHKAKFSIIRDKQERLITVKLDS